MHGYVFSEVRVYVYVYTCRVKVYRSLLWRCSWLPPVEVNLFSQFRTSCFYLMGLIPLTIIAPCHNFKLVHFFNKYHILKYFCSFCHCKHGEEKSTITTARPKFYPVIDFHLPNKIKPNLFNSVSLRSLVYNIQEYAMNSFQMYSQQSTWSPLKLHQLTFQTPTEWFILYSVYSALALYKVHNFKCFHVLPANPFQMAMSHQARFTTATATPVGTNFLC